MRKSNYDKQPSTHIEGKVIKGWDSIVKTLSEAWADEPVWAIDLYPGTYEEDFIAAFAKTGRKIINFCQDGQEDYQYPRPDATGRGNPTTHRTLHDG